jgi:hypothetical protein
MKMKLSISFPNQSQSFAHGVEYGRILQQMQDCKDVVMNHGFPIRIENKDLMEITCQEYGYIPTFGKTYENEWIEFLGIRKTSTES